MAPGRIIEKDDPKYKKIEQQMNRSTVKYKIIKVQEIHNERLLKGFKRRRRIMEKFNNGEINEKWLFHGSPSFSKIVDTGFKESLARGGNFGAGIYFADDPQKSNCYIGGCSRHGLGGCTSCYRYLLLCRVLLGKTYKTTTIGTALNSLPGYDSISANLPMNEYIVLKGDQTYARYIIKFLPEP